MTLLYASRTLALFVFCSPLFSLAGEAKPTTKPEEPAVVRKGKYGARDVEIKLQDGSLLRGEIQENEGIVLKTAYGVLTIPLSDILRIDRGDHLSERDKDEITAALKDLDNDEFAKRAAAQYRLETCSAAAIDLLKSALKTATAESKTRLDAILKKLTVRNSAHKTQVEDTVRTVRFEGAGTLQFDSLHLKSRIGDVAIKLDDLAGVRWLNRGEQKNLVLDPNTALGEWVDTGIDITPGERIAVAVSGSINPNNNMDIGPQGSDNWGNQGGFLMGAVIGKLGNSGESFLIGNGKIWNGDAKDRLYMRIHWNSRQMGRSSERSKGGFQIKIATGSWIEDMDLSAIQKD